MNKTEAMTITGIILLLVLIYGSYWVTKTVSYKVFYKDMVEQTVKQMVSPEALRN